MSYDSRNAAIPYQISRQAFGPLDGRTGTERIYVNDFELLPDHYANYIICNPGVNFITLSDRIRDSFTVTIHNFSESAVSFSDEFEISAGVSLKLQKVAEEWRTVGGSAEVPNRLGIGEVSNEPADILVTKNGKTAQLVQDPDFGLKYEGKGSITIGTRLDTGVVGRVGLSVGFDNVVAEEASTALGTGLITSGVSQTAVGEFNVDYTGDPNVDPVFQVGVGQDNNNRADAILVERDGTVTISDIETTISPDQITPPGNDQDLLFNDAGSLGARTTIPSNKVDLAGSEGQVLFNEAGKITPKDTIVFKNDSVGVFTANPLEGFHLRGAFSRSNFLIEETSTGDPNFIMRSPGGEWKFSVDQSDSNRLKFAANHVNVSYNSPIAIDPDGSVLFGAYDDNFGTSKIGFGVQAPAFNFDVNFESRFQKLARFEQGILLDGVNNEAQVLANKTVLGQWSDDYSADNSVDPIFQIGIGQDNNNRADAILVESDGTVTIPGLVSSLDIGQISPPGTDGQVLFNNAGDFAATSVLTVSPTEALIDKATFGDAVDPLQSEVLTVGGNSKFKGEVVVNDAIDAKGDVILTADNETRFKLSANGSGDLVLTEI